jgi:hypothetical protein
VKPQEVVPGQAETADGWLLGEAQLYRCSQKGGLGAAGRNARPLPERHLDEAPTKLDEATFARLAAEAEKNCPVSKVLNATITLDAKLI